jgi:hypothetical protein
MNSRQKACSLGAVVLISLPATLFARTNIITTGLSSSYDYDDRQKEVLPANQLNASENDLSSIALQPLLDFVSETQQDRFELRVAPSFKYDFNDSKTDWDNDILVSADRFMTKDWQLSASNAYLRTNYYDIQAGGITTTGNINSQNAIPELSANLGRTRYWQNILQAESKYFYDQECLIDFGGDYTVLRNDKPDTNVLTSLEDYDRYAVHFNNEHRYNTTWKTLAALNLARGDFSSANTVTDIVPESIGDTLSFDLNEYRFLATVENYYIENNRFSLNHNYIGTQYDEELRSDGRIHQSRLSWRHEFSPQLNSTLGAGPSYEKTDGRASHSGVNGIAELNYLIPRGSLTVGVIKNYDMDNFSGTNESGFIDYWDAHFLLNYQLFENVTLNGRIAYRDEHRHQALVASVRSLEAFDPARDGYDRELVTTGIGLHYTFLQHYVAGFDYSYTKQDSDRIASDYEDHRLFFTLSWKQEWLRW